jgi:hypothetical protein
MRQYLFMLDIAVHEKPLQMNFTVSVYSPTADPPVTLCKLLCSISFHAHLSGILQSSNDTELDLLRTLLAVETQCR